MYHVIQHTHTHTYYVYIHMHTFAYKQLTDVYDQVSIYKSVNRLEVCDCGMMPLFCQPNYYLVSVKLLSCGMNRSVFYFSHVRCSYRLIGIGLCDFVFCVTSKMEYAIL